jgi:hypothetical protein
MPKVQKVTFQGKQKTDFHDKSEKYKHFLLLINILYSNYSMYDLNVKVISSVLAKKAAYAFYKI